MPEQAEQANLNISRTRESYFSAWCKSRNRNLPVPPVRPVREAVLVPSKEETEPRHLPGKTWSAEDERGLSKCKSCHQPIVWGELEEYEPRLTSNRTSMEWVKKTGPTRFRPLDPDLFPHACRKAKVVGPVSDQDEAG